MTYFLSVVKLLILCFTLYHFSKNHEVKKPYQKRKKPESVFKENPKLKDYKHLLGIKNQFDSASLKQAYRKMVINELPAEPLAVPIEILCFLAY